ncbi:MAG: ABC transporter ATP-binding protein, partial [Candidatus Omnitrophica bacterium]|nr:ABC transporter ATP-binding protein [Candidatus Omnitrophota bacterium]
MLTVDGLSCGYGGEFFLKDISFTLGEKEILGIIGPNGSGKTTLLRALIKALRPAGGTIRFEGRDISGLAQREVARSIAVVGQDTAPYFEMSVEEFVSLGRIPHQQDFQFFESRRDEEIVQGAMRLTDTLRFRERLISRLSQGERQLVVIAKALAQEPKLLLLDEPIVYLDISHQVQIMDLVRRLNRREGLSVLVVLHELNLASEYCDKLILLNNGMVHAQGTPQEVLDYRIIEEV